MLSFADCENRRVSAFEKQNRPEKPFNLLKNRERISAGKGFSWVRNYLVSLWMVCLLQNLQCFFISILSGSFFLFFLET